MPATIRFCKFLGEFLVKTFNGRANDWVDVYLQLPKIISYSHASAAFDTYQTFRIKPHSEIEALSRRGHETYQRLDTLIAGQMKAKGYQTHLDPDLLIDYEISTGLSQNTPSQNFDRYSWYNWYYPAIIFPCKSSTWKQ